MKIATKLDGYDLLISVTISRTNPSIQWLNEKSGASHVQTSNSKKFQEDFGFDVSYWVVLLFKARE